MYTTCYCQRTLVSSTPFWAPPALVSAKACAGEERVPGTETWEPVIPSGFKHH